jgi:predicted Zn-dependent peptidase
MEFKYAELANGLTIIGEINNSAQSAAVGFFVRTGARDEDLTINGVSHFLEHMLFKGTDRLNALQVNEAFDQTGAQFNAATSEENTVYYAAVLPEYLAEVTQLWTQLLTPALRQEDFELEKNVIKEEIAMYKDDPHFDAFERCRRLHFGDHPCGLSVLGSEENIHKLTVTQMRQYREQRYAANNITFACTGNFDWQQMKILIEHNCSGWQKQPVTRASEHCSGSKLKQRIERTNLVCEHICLISTAVSAQDPRRFAAALLSIVVGDETGSRFFWELVDTALAETATMHFEAMDGLGVFYSYILCGPEKTDHVMDKVEQIFRDLTQKGITEQELRKARNKALSALAIKNELPMGRLVELGFNWTYLQQYLTVQENIGLINAVTVKDIQQLIEQLNPGQFTQLAVGPARQH